MLYLYVCVCSRFGLFSKLHFTQTFSVPGYDNVKPHDNNSVAELQRRRPKFSIQTRVRVVCRCVRTIILLHQTGGYLVAQSADHGTFPLVIYPPPRENNSFRTIVADFKQSTKPVVMINKSFSSIIIMITIYWSSLYGARVCSVLRSKNTILYGSFFANITRVTGKYNILLNLCGYNKQRFNDNKDSFIGTMANNVPPRMSIPITKSNKLSFRPIHFWEAWKKYTCTYEPYPQDSLSWNMPLCKCRPKKLSNTVQTRYPPLRH